MPNAQTPTTTLNDPIPGSTATDLFETLQHHKSRLIIKEVVEDYVGSSVFAKRVKDIELEMLESTETYKKVSDKVQNQINTTLNDRNLKNRNFLIVNSLSALAVLTAIISVIVAISKN